MKNSRLAILWEIFVKLCYGYATMYRGRRGKSNAIFKILIIFYKLKKKKDEIVSVLF